MIKKIIRWTLNHLPTKKIILFESNPDLSDNTKPVFDELVRRGYNKKYKMIWMLYDGIKGEYPKIENVVYLDAKKHRFKWSFYNHTAKVTVCCNRFLGEKRKGQTNFYLCHGSPLKDTGSYYTLPESINYVVSQGEIFTDELARVFGISKNIIYPIGFPRNTVLLKQNIKLSDYFGTYKKYIVWYPTVRQFKTGRCTGSKYALPIIHDLDSAVKLNECAKKNDALIILKPHFAQDISFIKNLQLSNIVFINDEFLKKHGVSSYELVGCSDALLTDYSSVYYDYLLCDKPIGLIWEDVAEYAVLPGLVHDYKVLCSGGEQVYNVEELNQFIERVADGVDIKKEQRHMICDKVNVKDQNKVTANVVDFILDKI